MHEQDQPASLNTNLSKSVIQIGGLSLRLCGTCPKDIWFTSGITAFSGFGRDVDINISIEWGDDPRFHPRSTVFDSGGVWALFSNGSDLVFDFVSAALGELSYKSLYVNTSFELARVTLAREIFQLHRSMRALDFPLDELLFTNYLAAHALGVEVHGCGLIDAETGGHLLLGHSGAGKSTTAYLWQSLRNPEILSDDRIILRIEGGELWMYGTPWHGEGCFASPNKAKLNRILVLKHGERNELVELPRALAAAELFARSFPPFHSPEGLQNVMDFLNKVVHLVPCYEFRFVPDASAVETVLEMQRESLIA